MTSKSYLKSCKQLVLTSALAVLSLFAFNSASGQCNLKDSVTVTQPTCLNPSGSATVHVTGGTGIYSYSWSNSKVNASTNTGLAAGTYTVKTTDDSTACTVTTTITVSAAPSAPIADIQAETDVACYNGNTGNSAVAAVQGTPPYTYLWSNSAGTSSIINNVGAGTYSVTVTDAKGCTGVTSIVINQPSSPITTSLSTTNATAGCNGGISATVAGGTSPYMFHWSNDSLTGPSDNGLCPSTYTLTVTDANGCTMIQTAKIDTGSVSNPCANSTLMVATTAINATSGCNGGATATATGGYAPYSYIWSTANQSTSSALTGLCAGTYSLTVTDSKGCTKVSSVMVVIDTTKSTTCSNPPTVAIQSVTNTLCFGSNTGSAVIMAQGGTPPYSYSWSPIGGNTSTLSNASAGTYTVSVIDSKGCSANTSVSISQSAMIAISLSTTNATSGCNGGITATVAGGTSPYLFHWSNDSLTGPSDNGLCPSTYTLTVTDANGCSSSSNFSITSTTDTTKSNPCANSTLLITTNTMNPTSGCNGGITATVTGGKSPYVYHWNNDSISTPSQNKLCPGTYTLTVTDANGCNAIATAALMKDSVNTSSNPCNNNPIKLNAQVTNVTTATVCNGAITDSVMGGYPPFKFIWSNGASTPQISNLCMGAYSVQVIDSKGCTSSQNFGVLSNDTSACANSTLAISFNTVSSAQGACNGSLKAMITGGFPPYIMHWNTQASTASLIDVCPGSYTLNVLDSKGCLKTQTVTVDTGGVNPCIKTTIVTTSTATATTNLLTCNGNASVQVTGGAAPYRFNWNNGTTSSNAGNLCVGTYSVTITDNNGCVGNTTLTVNAKDSSSTAVNTCATLAVTISASSSVATCVGTASAIATGGTAPYKYNWSNYYNIPNQTNLCPGNYVVTVVDANGCVAEANANIALTTSAVIPPLKAFVNITDATTPGNCDGTAEVSVSGGTPPYYFQYSDGNTGATDISLCPGFYHLKVSDSKGMVDSLVFVIASPANVFADTTSKKNTLADSVVVATVKSTAIPNCAINYANVDSVTIGGQAALSQDSITVTWNVYVVGSSVPTKVVDHYAVNGTGVYTVILQLFCEGSNVAKMSAAAGVLKGVGQVYFVFTNIAEGISNISPAKPTVYPIPCTDHLVIQLNESGTHRLTVYDLTGRAVIATMQNTTQSQQQINTSFLANGSYILKVEGPNGVQFVKLIKE